MAPTKLTALSTAFGNVIDTNSRVYVVRDVAGTPQSVQMTLGGMLGAMTHPMGVRLTLTSNAQVTTTDVTNATTLYITPAFGQHGFVSLWYSSSSAWVILEFAQKSISLSGLASNCYDVTLELNTGTGAIDTALTAWTNVSTRATSLTEQNGLLMLSGTSKVYIGTIYLHSTGQCDDSDARRGVWNYYNRKMRRLYKFYNKPGSASYTTGAWRQYDNVTSTMVQHVQGWLEDCAFYSLGGDAQGGSGYLAIGLNSTTGNAPAVRDAGTLNSGGISQVYYPQVGLNTIYMTEYGAAGFSSASAALQGFIMG